MSIVFRLKEHIGRWEADNRKRLTMDELATVTGISVPTLSRIADPVVDCDTSSKNLETLCRFFKITLDQFARFDPPLQSIQSTVVAMAERRISENPTAPSLSDDDPVFQVIAKYIKERHDGWWEQWLVHVARTAFDAPAPRRGDRVVVRGKGVTVKGTGSPSWNIAISAAGDRVRAAENSDSKFNHAIYDELTELHRLCASIRQFLQEEYQRTTAKPTGSPLSHYFTLDGARLALDRYANFAADKGWEIGHKIDLYTAAAKAFADGDESDEQRLQAFGRIYGSLSTHWQVFRHGESHWPIEKVFEVLNVSCEPCSRLHPIALGKIDTDNIPTIQSCLQHLNELKTLRSGEAPVMAASKFLHFFNPSLFPIYDRTVIGGKVLFTFRGEFLEFCAANNRDSTSQGFDGYLDYLLWASLVTAQADEGVMDLFCDWLGDQLAQPRDSLRVSTELQTYYATAFEFIAIGAELIERDRGF